jgi:hypothetical protein
MAVEARTACTSGAARCLGQAGGSEPDRPVHHVKGLLPVLTLRVLAEGESGLLFRSAQVSDRSGSPQPVGNMAGGMVSVGQGYRVYLPLVLRNR